MMHEERELEAGEGGIFKKREKNTGKEMLGREKHKATREEVNEGNKIHAAAEPIGPWHFTLTFG